MNLVFSVDKNLCAAIFFSVFPEFFCHGSPFFRSGFCFSAQFFYTFGSFNICRFGIGLFTISIIFSGLSSIGQGCKRFWLKGCLFWYALKIGDCTALKERPLWYLHWSNEQRHRVQLQVHWYENSCVHGNATISKFSIIPKIQSQDGLMSSDFINPFIHIDVVQE